MKPYKESAGDSLEWSRRAEQKDRKEAVGIHQEHSTQRTKGTVWQGLQAWGWVVSSSGASTHHMGHPPSSIPRCAGSHKCQVSWTSASSFTSDFTEWRRGETLTTLEAGTTALPRTVISSTLTCTVQDRQCQEHIALLLEEPCSLQARLMPDSFCIHLVP